MTQDPPPIDGVLRGLRDAMCHVLVENGSPGPHMVAAMADEKLVGTVDVNGWMTPDDRDGIVRAVANWVRAVGGDTVITAMHSRVAAVPESDDHPTPIDDPAADEAIVTAVYGRAGRWDVCFVVRYHYGDRGEVTFDPVEYAEIAPDAFPPLGLALSEVGQVIDRHAAEDALRTLGCLPSGP